MSTQRCHTTCRGESSGGLARYHARGYRFFVKPDICRPPRIGQTPRKPKSSSDVSHGQKGGRKTWVGAAMWISILLLTDSVFFFLNRDAIIGEHFRMTFTGRYAPPASIGIDKLSPKSIHEPRGYSHYRDVRDRHIDVNHPPTSTVVQVAALFLASPHRIHSRESEPSASNKRRSQSVHVAELRAACPLRFVSSGS
jgi:hypothetical protein